MNIDPNGFPETNSGFHSQATPLQQAVSSGSLNSVKLLVEAGARVDATDKLHHGKPLGWSRHMQTDDSFDEAGKRNFDMIETFLQFGVKNLGLFFKVLKTYSFVILHYHSRTLLCAYARQLNIR
jgi:hypothetical protein